MTTKKVKIPWWNLPQNVLDKAVEEGIDYTNVEWICIVSKNKKIRYEVDKSE